MIDSLKETRFYQEAKEDGQRSLVLQLLRQKVGKLNAKITAQIAKLDLEQIERLAIALLNFESIEDLTNWLSQNS
jgi:predicted transposase YdaD